MFEGVSVALVTPFRDGVVDFDALGRLVEQVLSGGVDGLVALGSTGEGSTLEEEERDAVLRFVKERAGGRAFVLAGTGCISTAQTLARTRRARELGMDGALISPPPYNKPTPDGLLAHFRAVVEAVDLPVVLYNVPGRTAVPLDVPTVLTLAEHPRIVAVKESSGSTDQVTLLARARRLTVLSGDDNMTLPLISVGAEGVVSVVGNLFPRATVELVRAAREGDHERARALHFVLMPLFKALFIESNPLPTKHALAARELIREEFRLPLVPMTRPNAEKVDGIVAKVRAEFEAMGEDAL